MAGMAKMAESESEDSKKSIFPMFLTTLAKITGLAKIAGLSGHVKRKSEVRECL